MFRRSKKQTNAYVTWLPLALAFVSALVVWWVRRRVQGLPEQADRPAIWRRDIEMGPKGSSYENETALQAQPGEIDRIEGEVDREDQVGARSAVPATGTPDVQSGAGSILLEEPLPQVPELEIPVEGPIPGAESPEETPGGDDLAIIDGIGPKINTILQDAGIRTFADLANTQVSRLEQILRDSNLRIANPETWPEQARLAATGDWSKLEAFIQQQKNSRKG